jgi:hypothetical protein
MDIWKGYLIMKHIWRRFWVVIFPIYVIFQGAKTNSSAKTHEDEEEFSIADHSDLTNFNLKDEWYYTSWLGLTMRASCLLTLLSLFFNVCPLVTDSDSCYYN